MHIIIMDCGGFGIYELYNTFCKCPYVIHAPRNPIILGVFDWGGGGGGMLYVYFL